MIREEEFAQEFASVVKAAGELAMAASEQEKTWGRKEDFRWIYDQESSKLIIIPSEELVGKEKRIFLDLDGEEFILFEGTLPERLEFPLPPEGYLYDVFNNRLKIGDV
jgi:hypothetical protein